MFQLEHVPNIILRKTMEKKYYYFYKQCPTNKTLMEFINEHGQKGYRVISIEKDEYDRTYVLFEETINDD